MVSFTPNQLKLIADAIHTATAVPYHTKSYINPEGIVSRTLAALNTSVFNETKLSVAIEALERNAQEHLRSLFIGGVDEIPTPAARTAKRALDRIKEMKGDSD